MNSLEQLVFQSNLFDYVGVRNHNVLHKTSDIRPPAPAFFIVERSVER